MQAHYPKGIEWQKNDAKHYPQSETFQTISKSDEKTEPYLVFHKYNHVACFANEDEAQKVNSLD